MTPKLKFVSGRVENTVGKGENAGNQHFLLFPLCFQKASYAGSLKVGIVWCRVVLLANLEILGNKTTSALNPVSNEKF